MLCNRSFFHASTSHGYVTNGGDGGLRKWFDPRNAAPTIFNRLEDDHVAPGAAVPPDDTVGEHGFGFDRLGVRVPAIAISAYTGRNTVINDTHPPYIPINPEAAGPGPGDEDRPLSPPGIGLVGLLSVKRTSSSTGKVRGCSGDDQSPVARIGLKNPHTDAADGDPCPKLAPNRSRTWRASPGST